MVVKRTTAARAPARTTPLELHGSAPATTQAGQGQVPELDRLIHERMRLGIVGALAVNAGLSFNDLKALLRTTDGNLSVHARKLEEAEYITCIKYFERRVPKTEYQLTEIVRRALERYPDHMEALGNAATLNDPTDLFFWSRTL